MDEILKTLVKIVPIAEWLRHWGISEELSISLAAVINSVIIYLLWKAFRYGANQLIDYKTAKDLAPFFEKPAVEKYRKYYIETKGQGESPTREEEPGFGEKFIPKENLIPFFIKKVFDENKETDKFYMILADSGMGKTTFMINLYMRYHSVFNFRRKYKMKLFPFSDSRILERIKKIPEDEIGDTILLLDAFDEDKALQKTKEEEVLTDDERFRKRMDEIMEAVEDFREVVITCRSQFFPGHEKDTYELPVRKYNDEGFHILAKLYISCFDKKDIKKFLGKKYGVLRFWNLKKKRKAGEIVNNSPKLMVRPMLLSYIDLLVDKGKIYRNTFEIYERLIEQWLEREAIKRKYLKERPEFITRLRKYSQLLAKEIYHNRSSNSSLAVCKKDAMKIRSENNINLEDYEVTGQSLLTKDAAGNWKFAHKSIFEFFIANEAIKDKRFRKQVNWRNYDMTRKFVEEVLVPENFVWVETDETVNGLEDFCICKYQVTQKEWKAVMGKNPSIFTRDNDPVENVSWNDALDYIKKLNEKTGLDYRLPTEEEWDFAARGGLKSKGFDYSGSNNIDKVAWYSGNSEYKTHPVGELEANELGIYDMSGNVWEWTSTEDGGRRGARGGGWGDDAEYCRVAYCRWDRPGDRCGYVGFRRALGL